RYVALLRNEQGQQAAGREGDMELNLDGGTRGRLERQGLEAALPISAPPGNYQLLVVVQEGARGATSTFGPTWIQIR
ncbi:MAG: hypothetical protein ACRD1E_00875, partial [Terriglobales bacterium]